MPIFTKAPWDIYPTGITQAYRAPADIGVGKMAAWQVLVLSLGGARIKVRNYADQDTSSGFANFGYFTTSATWEASNDLPWQEPGPGVTPLSTVVEGRMAAKRMTATTAPVVGMSFNTPTPLLGGPNHDWHVDLYVPYNTYFFMEEYETNAPFVSTIYLYEFSSGAPIG